MLRPSGTIGRPRKLLLVAVNALLLSACATPYQEMGMLGGVQATQITHDTFQVTARGNGYTDPDTIQRYVLRKAAEATLSAGYDYFAIGDALDRTRTAQVAYGNSSYHRGFASGFAMSSSIIKPGQTVLIKAYKGTPPDPTPSDVFDAHEIVQYMAGAGGFKGMSSSAISEHRDCHIVDGSVKCEPSPSR